MSFVLESEPVSMQRRLQPWCSINAKDRVLDVMYLAELRENIRVTA